MSFEKKNHLLLPRGFSDLLPPDAQREADAITALMALFTGYGYQRVKPPLVEFEDTLFADGPGAALPQETFRVLDPLSHRMMGVRSDITVQIARIATSRLRAAARPLRLTYANDVLRTKANQQRTERQFCKVGCEMIGNHNPQGDAELCILSLLGLKTLGIEGITIDIALPDLSRHLFAAHGISGEDAAVIQTHLDNRDLPALHSLENRTLSAQLCALAGAIGTPDHALPCLRAIDLPPAARAECDTLSTLCGLIQSALDDLGFTDISLSVDPLESNGFQYQNGAAFALYATGIHGALGRGGGYDIPVLGGAERAFGFTLYMDTVRKAMPPATAAPDTLRAMPTQTSWKTLEELRTSGYRVVRET